MVYFHFGPEILIQKSIYNSATAHGFLCIKLNKNLKKICSNESSSTEVKLMYRIAVTKIAVPRYIVRIIYRILRVSCVNDTHIELAPRVMY